MLNEKKPGIQFAEKPARTDQERSFERVREEAATKKRGEEARMVADALVRLDSAIKGATTYLALVEPVATTWGKWIEASQERLNHVPRNLLTAQSGSYWFNQANRVVNLVCGVFATASTARRALKLVSELSAEGVRPVDWGVYIGRIEADLNTANFDPRPTLDDAEAGLSAAFEKLANILKSEREAREVEAGN